MSNISNKNAQNALLPRRMTTTLSSPNKGAFGESDRFHPKKGLNNFFN